jgi:hypothetical protein
VLLVPTHLAEARRPAQPTARDVLRKDRLDRIVRILLDRRVFLSTTGRGRLSTPMGDPGTAQTILDRRRTKVSSRDRRILPIRDASAQSEIKPHAIQQPPLSQERQEGTMDEVFPVLAGVVIGLGIHRFIPRRLKALVLGVLSVAFGVLASWVSGELAISAAYLVIDIGQVALVGVMTWGLATGWQRRSWRVL